MIITAQRKLRFKPEDQPAMERRLRTYSFKSLQNPKKRAAAWLRLTENEVATFCEDFLKLLNYNRKPQKDKVPCLVGQTNSGKTSLFMPILGIIHHSNVATITKQRVFNKVMISNNTEVIFINEATESTMDIDD